HADARDRTTMLARVDADISGFAKQCPESLPRRANAEPRPVRRHIRLARARSVVRDRDLDDAARLARTNLQLAGRRRTRDAVTHGVLDQRLNEQRLHERVAQRIVDAPFDAKPVAEPNQLDAEISLHEAQLDRQWYQLR